LIDWSSLPEQNWREKGRGAGGGRGRARRTRHRRRVTTLPSSSFTTDLGPPPRVADADRLGTRVRFHDVLNLFQRLGATHPHGRGAPEVAWGREGGGEGVFLFFARRRGAWPPPGELQTRARVPHSRLVFSRHNSAGGGWAVGAKAAPRARASRRAPLRGAQGGRRARRRRRLFSERQRPTTTPAARARPAEAGRQRRGGPQAARRAPRAPSSHL